MSDRRDELQAILQEMLLQFLDELPDRCDLLEELVLHLEKEPDDNESYNRLFREAHSLKGLGGTLDLAIIVEICHQFENVLNEASSKNTFDKQFSDVSLSHIDLLRKVILIARSDSPDYAELTHELETLRSETLANRKTVLIAEKSALMTRLYRAAFLDYDVQFTQLDNGFHVLEHLIRRRFDLAIIGGELDELNGLAVVSAVRLAGGVNHQIPICLVSSKTSGHPEHLNLQAVFPRDKHLSENLLRVLHDIW